MPAQPSEDKLLPLRKIGQHTAVQPFPARHKFAAVAVELRTAVEFRNLVALGRMPGYRNPLDLIAVDIVSLLHRE